MAVSIIDVVVNDEKFQGFLKLFERYKDSVKGLPQDWNRIGGSIQKNSEQLQKTIDAVEHQRKVVKDLEALRKQTSQAEKKRLEELQAVERSRFNEAKAHALQALTSKDGGLGSKVQEVLFIVERFQTSVRKMDGEWQKAQDATEETAQSSSKVTEELEQQKQLLADLERDKKKAFETEKKRIDDLKKEDRKRFDDLKEQIHKTSDSIKDIAMGIFKGLGIAGILSGLAGAGGLFGLDQLAHGITDERKQALGVGVTPGQAKALGVNYDPILDTNHTLQNIADVLSDPSKRYAFSAMGVRPEGKDPAQLLVELTSKAKELFGKSDKTQYQAEALGLTQFFDMNTLRRLDKLTKDEIDRAGQRAKADEAALTLSPQQMRSMADFSRSMTLANQRIQVLIAEAIGPLIPYLTKLSQSVVNSISAFLKSGQLEPLMHKLGDGLKWVIDKLDDPKVQKGLQDFADNLFKVVGALAGTLDKINEIWDNITGRINLSPEEKKRQDEMRKGPLGFLMPNGQRPLEQSLQNFGNFTFLQPLAQRFQSGAATPLAGRAAGFREIEADVAGQKVAFDPEVLKRIWGRESGFGANNVTNPLSGAQGHFQFMPDTARRYGVADPFDFHQSAAGAARLLADLIKTYHGDLRKAVAAYAGDTHIKQEVKEHGANWLQYSKARDYVQDVTRGLNVNVNIRNPTGTVTQDVANATAGTYR